MDDSPESTDPLDLNVVVSDEEHHNGELSPEHVRLGTLLLHARGYVVLKGALPKPLVEALRSNFQRLYEDCMRRFQAGLGRPRRGDEPRTTGTVFWERGSRFRIFPRLTGPFADRYVLRNPFADSIIAATLGEDYYCKSVSSDTCVKGSRWQAPHRDIGFYDKDGVAGCVVNIPLMHCGVHNGPIEVWPGGSHLWRGESFYKFDVLPFIQDDSNPAVEDLARHLPSKLIDLRPTDLLIRDPGMLHRGTPNPTDEPRTMLTAGYFRKDYFYPYGDPFDNLDERLFYELKPSVQQLFSPFFDERDWRYQKLRDGSSGELTPPQPRIPDDAINSHADSV
jgi:ectoine hydroxylase-related dioxygenase (phytanoyl-CoA dioxygenase family)